LRRARPLAEFRIGEEIVRTRNHFMVPAETGLVRVVPATTATAPRSRAEQHLEEALC
jgi:hypothetical protein